MYIVSACISALRPLIIVKFYGLENLTNAYGLQLFFIGIGILIGLPASAMIYDKTQSYQTIFVLFGSIYLCSGILLILTEIFRYFEKQGKL